MPLALAAAAFFITAINLALPGYAMVSAWMPHILLFPFLFYVVVCAWVASGNPRPLPLLAGAGMLLVHIHVAQCLLAGALGGAACVSGFLRSRGAAWIKPAAAAALVVACFLAPILVEIAIHEPDNLDAILSYSRAHPGQQKSWGAAAWYFGSFLVYIAQPQAAPPVPASLVSAFLTPRVAGYWALFAAAAACAWLAFRRSRPPLPPMLAFAALAGVAASILFVCWGTRIAGELYNFNGFFVYGMQLLFWLLLAAVIAKAAPARVLRAAWPAALVVLALCAPSFKISYHGLPELGGLGAHLPPPGTGGVRLDFAPADWTTAAGVAVQMARQGRPFCVVPEWEFAFGRRYVCPEVLARPRLLVSSAPGLTCAPPCRTLLREPNLSVALDPPAWNKLPLALDGTGGPGIKEDFYPPEQGGTWTRRAASIRFALAPDLGAGPCCRLRVLGSVLPGRPAELTLNGRKAGTIDHIWNSTAEFVVGRDWFRPGQENRVVLEVPNAGPLPGDYRELGMRFERLIEPLDKSGAAPRSGLLSGYHPPYG